MWQFQWDMFNRAFERHPKMGGWVREMRAQPSWVLKTAIGVGVLVVVVPIVLLTLTAVTAFVLAFLALGLVYRIGMGLRRLFTRERSSFPAPDGRENVRVVRRE